MADNNLLTALGTGALGLYGASTANNAIQSGINQGINYVTAGYQTAGQEMQPYTNMGAGAIPDYTAAVKAVGSPYTMEQFNQSPYALLAQKTIADQTNALKAMAGAKGMYGSGNMANQISQNALTTTLGAYDTAYQREMARRGAAANALYGQVGLGQTGAQALGQYATKAGESVAGLIGKGAEAKAGTISQQTNTGANMLKSILSSTTATAAIDKLASAASAAAISGWNKLKDAFSGTPNTALTDAEEAAVLNLLEDPSNEYSSIISNYEWTPDEWRNILSDYGPSASDYYSNIQQNA